jgi:hypothetical protein
VQVGNNPFEENHLFAAHQDSEAVYQKHRLLIQLREQ